MSAELSPAERVQRGQKLLAHAWMVRTFIKHCDEVEDFPELMEIARAVFDLCRALENKVETPQEYLRILRKKLSKFRAAVRQFAQEAPLASTHMNFQQAVVSIEAVAEELALLASGETPWGTTPKADPGRLTGETDPSAEAIHSQEEAERAD
jgi:hypothetical protein